MDAASAASAGARASPTFAAAAVASAPLSPAGTPRTRHAAALQPPLRTRRASARDAHISALDSAASAARAAAVAAARQRRVLLGARRPRLRLPGGARLGGSNRLLRRLGGGLEAETAVAPLALERRRNSPSARVSRPRAMCKIVELSPRSPRRGLGVAGARRRRLGARARRAASALQLPHARFSATARERAHYENAPPRRWPVVVRRVCPRLRRPGFRLRRRPRDLGFALALRAAPGRRLDGGVLFLRRRARGTISSSALAFASASGPRDARSASSLARSTAAPAASVASSARATVCVTAAAMPPRAPPARRAPFDTSRRP